MKTFFQIFGIVFLTILTLSINVKNRPLFSHIYKVISPLTTKAQNVTEDFLGDSVKRTNNYSKKIFENSIPKLKDSVKSGMSSTKRKLPLEDIPEVEKEELDELIKSHY
jgi:hypothetical protein